VHELRYSRRVTHQNVIRIYDFHNIQGSYAISMEYFPSHTLGSELLNGKPLELERAMQFAVDICTGMTVAHQVGIVHRDLKPANVLLDPDGEAWLTDFGIAVHRDDTGDISRACPKIAVDSQNTVALKPFGLDIPVTCADPVDFKRFRF